MKLIEQYEQIEHLTGDGAIVPHWEMVNNVVIKDILTPENKYFLNHQLFAENTFANHPQATRYIHQLDYIYANWDKSLANEVLQAEPTFGHAPLKRIDGMHVCPNSVQMMYHMAYWQVETGKDIRDMHHILEWGGGYGNFARLMQLVNPGAGYTIIDTPVYCTLSNWYLQNTTSASCGINDPFSTINIIPVGEAAKMPDCSLFVSTWALSESSDSIIREAATMMPIFSAPSVLMAFQDTNALFESASDVVHILNVDRERNYQPAIENVKQVDYLDKGNYYAVL